MAKIINDGAVQHGSRDITLSNGYTYATDDFRYDVASTVIERTNGLNVMTGRKVIEGATTGSATLQYSASDTPTPTMGLTFTEDEGVFYITGLGRAETKAGETKIPVNFAKAITADITTTDV